MLLMTFSQVCAEPIPAVVFFIVPFFFIFSIFMLVGGWKVCNPICFTTLFPFSSAVVSSLEIVNAWLNSPVVGSPIHLTCKLQLLCPFKYPLFSSFLLHGKTTVIISLLISVNKYFAFQLS